MMHRVFFPGLLPGALSGLLLLVAAPAHAGVSLGVFSLGVGAGVERDLADVAFPEERASWGLGPLVRLPTRVGLGDPSGAASLRLTPHFGLASGYDTLVWEDYGGSVTYVSRDHVSAVHHAGLDIGPEFALRGEGARLRPYFGVEGGLAWFSHTHDLDGAAAESLGGSASGVTLKTSQIAPRAGAHGGLTFHVSSSFALEAEAGYSVSFLKEAGLADTPERLGAVRAAYGWNAVSAGLGASFAFGNGTDR